MALYEKFGEFGSAGEINLLAENLFNEGDMESILTLSRENGIPEEYAQMYIDGETEELTDASTAAIGKIEVEEADLNAKDIIYTDWISYIKAECMGNDRMAKAVRAKEKSLKGCIGAILKWAFAHQQPVDKKILQAAGVKASRVTLGMPDKAVANKLIREYYA